MNSMLRARGGDGSSGVPALRPPGKGVPDSGRGHVTWIKNPPNVPPVFRSSLRRSRRTACSAKARPVTSYTACPGRLMRRTGLPSINSSKSLVGSSKRTTTSSPLKRDSK